MCHIIVHLERFYSEELNSVYGNVKGLTGFRQSCLPQFLCFFSLWLALLYQWLTENLPPKFNHNNVCCSSWRFWLPKARSRHVLQDYLKERWLFIQGGKFFTIDRNNYYYWFEQVWKVPCCRMLRTFFFILLDRRDCEDETGMDTGLRFDDRETKVRSFNIYKKFPENSVGQ